MSICQTTYRRQHKCIVLTGFNITYLVSILDLRVGDELFGVRVRFTG